MLIGTALQLKAITKIFHCEFLQFKFFQEPKIQHQKSSQSKVLSANDSFNASLGILMSRLLVDKQGTLQEIVQLFLCKKTIAVVSFEKMKDGQMQLTIQIQNVMNSFDLH